MVTSGMTIVFFIRVCIMFFVREAPTSYMQNPTWIRNISGIVTQ
jgi:hypothetical protein